MYSYANTPSGIVIMQSIDPNLFTIAHPLQGTFINAAASFNIYGPPPINNNNNNTCQAAALVDLSANMTQTMAFNRSLKMNCGDNRTISNRSLANRNNNYYNENQIRRTRSGHVSKSRVSKRAEANLTKTCPSCSKLWRFCNCSNVKNRPAPKPYCKFVPPRMLNKQRD